MHELQFSRDFFPSTAKLSVEERGRVLSFIDKLQENLAHPSISLERITESRSDDLWSGRISRELRAILFRQGDQVMLLHAGHHDDAYAWAKQRRIERNPKTKELQIVQLENVVREVVREVAPAEHSAPPLFRAHADEYLLSLGVPATHLPILREIRTEDQALKFIEAMPGSLGNYLLELLYGGFPTPPAPLAERKGAEPAPTSADVVVLRDAHQIQALLAAPMRQWIAFLHPSQQRLATRTLNGPAKVTGAAGTGKTVVGMHRARHWAAEGRRVLFTSYVTTLCNNLRRNLGLLCTPEEFARIQVATVHSEALRLCKQGGVNLRPLSDEAKALSDLLTRAAERLGVAFDASFLVAEWRSVIRTQDLRSWDEYRAASRSGRGRSLSVAERKACWSVFEAVQNELRSRGETDWMGLSNEARRLLESGKLSSPYDAIVVDELQDLQSPELRLLKALAARCPERLLLIGDAGQRIYPGGFSLKQLGIDVRGRSFTLKVHYRSTEQIRRLADRVLADNADDMDGEREKRGHARSLLSGPKPVLRGFGDDAEEAHTVATAIRDLLAEGLAPDEIAIFFRSPKPKEPVEDELASLGIPTYRLGRDEHDGPPAVALGTMHRAKGLEFKACFVMRVSATALPSRSALQAATDEEEREAALACERQLLYVAMTRARDRLWVTWSERPSDFLSGLTSA
ncbi:MAG: AAA family ATPase [Planctomycetes bacterium]|nr:AAA family ATPase [Planctomycetota bacterium]